MAASAVIYPPQHWGAYSSRRAEIEPLLDARCYTIDWLDVQILNDAARVFASDDAVIVVTLKQYPAGAVELHGLVAAGELAAILLLIDEAEEWARAGGVTFASIASREGWGRVLKSRQYVVHQVELRKDL